MNLSVLLSCMHQTDHSIIKKANLSSDAIIINQCDIDKTDEFNYKDKSGSSHRVKFISTKDRGLSKSRNIAIEESSSDICLLADDDEVFVDNYKELILDSFDNYNADVILFRLDKKSMKFPLEIKKVNYFRALKITSAQIAFRRKSIVGNSILFDEKMGSGTGNGSSEENKFVFDCLKNNLKILYIPHLIAKVKSGGSNWFKGFTNVYFLNRGWATRRYLGLMLAFLYLIYFSILKYRLYKKDNTFFNALYYQTKGLFLKR